MQRTDISDIMNVRYCFTLLVHLKPMWRLLIYVSFGMLHTSHDGFLMSGVESNSVGSLLIARNAAGLGAHGKIAKFSTASGIMLRSDFVSVLSCFE